MTNMTNLINKLRHLLSAKQKTDAVTAVPSPHSFDDATFIQLMQQVEATQEGQYTCQETGALLDEYVDLVVSKQDAARMMPLVEAHLRVCPECGLRYDILKTILEGDRESLNP